MPSATMTSPFLFLALALSIYVSFSSAFYYPDITSKTFDALLDPVESSILVEFYAPWCGHCKTLAPEFEKLGKAFEDVEEVIIAQVDADKHRDLGGRFKVQGFPTLKWIPKGSSFAQAEDVNAARTAIDLLKFVNEKSGLNKRLKAPADHVVQLNPDDFAKFSKSPDYHLFVAFIEPENPKCEAIIQMWKKLADLYSDDKHVIIATLDGDAFGNIAKAEHITSYPDIKYFGKNGSAKYEDKPNLQAIVDLVNKKTGLEISLDGGLLSSAGRIAEIGQYVKSFVKANTRKERQKLIDTCSASVASLSSASKENYKYYSKLFTRVAEQGATYIGKEAKRLQDLLKDKRNMQRTQRKKFEKRLNVLKEFDEL